MHSARAVTRHRHLPATIFGLRSVFGYRHVCAEHIADVSHCLDQCRPLRVALYFAAKASHLHVDAAIERVGIAAAGVVEQLFAGERPVGPGRECYQQIEFTPGQINRIAGIRNQRSSVTIENSV
jgi:hypothetical protein